MTHTQKELSSNYTEQANNNASTSDQIVEQHKVENTPFTIVKVDTQWFLTMGKYRLTEPTPTREETEAQVHDVTWNRLVQVMMIITEEQINNLNNKKPN